MYALTNEISTSAGGPLRITDTVLTGAGQFVIAFKGFPQATYQITKSADLNGPFVPLDIPLSVNTDINGDGQAIIPASEASEAKEFYRVEE